MYKLRDHALQESEQMLAEGFLASYKNDTLLQAGYVEQGGSSVRSS